jgi:CBS domain-containing protein
MQLKNVIDRTVDSVTPDTPLKNAARVMSKRNVQMLPVCCRGYLVGLLTLRDLTVRATSQGRDPGTTKVAEVMSREIFYCHDDEDVQAAAKIMYGRHLSRLPVVDRDSRLVGIVSLRNIKPEARSASASEHPGPAGKAQR